MEAETKLEDNVLGVQYNTLPQVLKDLSVRLIDQSTMPYLTIEDVDDYENIKNSIEDIFKDKSNNKTIILERKISWWPTRWWYRLLGALGISGLGAAYYYKNR